MAPAYHCTLSGEGIKTTNLQQVLKIELVADLSYMMCASMKRNIEDTKLCDNGYTPSSSSSCVV
jgi:bacterioferritin (cytochrome b1)